MSIAASGIDLPGAIAQVSAAFHASETALMREDIAAMDALFHAAPSTVRDGVGELLYGIDAIRAFRIGRGGSPQRHLAHVQVHGFGHDFATTHAELVRVEPDLAPGIHRLHLAMGAPLLTGKLVLAIGIQGGGQWMVPDWISRALPAQRYATTSGHIDFAALAGKRVGISGGGASAFDNACFALDQGVASAEVFVRRSELPRINPFRHMEQAGIIPRFLALPDADKVPHDGQLLRAQPAAHQRHLTNAPVRMPASRCILARRGWT